MDLTIKEGEGKERTYAGTNTGHLNKVIAINIKGSTYLHLQNSGSGNRMWINYKLGSDSTEGNGFNKIQ